MGGSEDAGLVLHWDMNKTDCARNGSLSAPSCLSTRAAVEPVSAARPLQLRTSAEVSLIPFHAAAPGIACARAATRWQAPMNPRHRRPPTGPRAVVPRRRPRDGGIAHAHRDALPDSTASVPERTTTASEPSVLDGHACGNPVATPYFRSEISTRRLRARPSAVSFDAAGLVSPCPVAATESAFSPCSRRYPRRHRRGASTGLVVCIRAGRVGITVHFHTREMPVALLAQQRVERGGGGGRQHGGVGREVRIAGQAHLLDRGGRRRSRRGDRRGRRTALEHHRVRIGAVAVWRRGIDRAHGFVAAHARRDLHAGIGARQDAVTVDTERPDAVAGLKFVCVVRRSRCARTGRETTDASSARWMFSLEDSENARAQRVRRDGAAAPRAFAFDAVRPGSACRREPQRDYFH